MPSGMPRGLFKDSGGWVRVDYGGKFQMPMHRSDYDDHAYKPRFEALPLKETYEKTKGRLRN